jgi:hypothetical protein
VIATPRGVAPVPVVAGHCRPRGRAALTLCEAGQEQPPTHISPPSHSLSPRAPLCHPPLCFVIIGHRHTHPLPSKSADASASMSFSVDVDREPKLMATPLARAVYPAASASARITSSIAVPHHPPGEPLLPKTSLQSTSPFPPEAHRR